jgi:hypothetical protein
MKHIMAIMFKATLSSNLGLYIKIQSVLEMCFASILMWRRHEEISVPLGSRLHLCPREAQETMKINSLNYCATRL